jgi:hypothetical protein
MISSSKLAISIANDLDQNAYTSWYNDPKILDAINSACNFVLAYWKWPWSLVSWEITESTAVRAFTFTHELFYPYWAYLDETEKKLTVVPIIDFLHLDTWKVYVDSNVVRTTESGLKINILYHRWHDFLTSLWIDDINMPETMFQALIHVALWFLYPGGLDIWSWLANQNYNMAKTILDTYAKAYGKSIQPEQMAPAAHY